jgi:hypothetical protein
MTQDEIIASNLSEVEKANERIKMLEDKLASIKQALAELESQEPVAQPAPVQDLLIQCLELIAVKDSKDPAKDAADTLVEVGFWTTRIAHRARADTEQEPDWKDGVMEQQAETILWQAKRIAELESQESNPIKDGWKLSVADGHSGYGVYAHMEEYPEEGAFLLLPIKELESQEPVATVTSETGADITMSWWHEPALPIGTKLYTHPPHRTEQEPVVWAMPQGWWIVESTPDKLKMWPTNEDILLDSALAQPPQRTWVGLTDEDISSVIMKLQEMYHRPPIEIFARGIEAKLKEKNT